MSNNEPDQSKEAGYFTSPESAVPIISDLLCNGEFKTLASYYDLSESDVSLAELESGEFFIRTERPEVAHPGGFWRYKHPFAPGFKYSNMRSCSRDGVYLIKVTISIDQGVDSPCQVGFNSFYMIQSDKGWKILPDPVLPQPEDDVLLQPIEPLPPPPWE